MSQIIPRVLISDPKGLERSLKVFYKVGRGVAPFPTHLGVVTIEKGSYLVALDYGLHRRTKGKPSKVASLLRSARTLKRVLETWRDLLPLRPQSKTISLRLCEELTKSKNIKPWGYHWDNSRPKFWEESWGLAVTQKYCDRLYR